MQCSSGIASSRDEEPPTVPGHKMAIMEWSSVDGSEEEGSPVSEDGGRTSLDQPDANSAASRY